jgi:hypothetical protein
LEKDGLEYINLVIEIQTQKPKKMIIRGASKKALVWASSKAREEGDAFNARLGVERRKRYHC